MKAMWRGVGAAATALVLVSVWAASASADLAIEIRAPGEPGPGAVIPVTGPGQQIDLELWVTVTGGGGGSLLSFRAGAHTPGGLVLGETWCEVRGLPDLFLAFSNSSWHAMGNEAERDFDGDGDPDGIGSPQMNHDEGWLFGGVSPQWPESMWPAPPVQIGTVHVGPLTWGPDYDPTGPSGVTQVLPLNPFTKPGENYQWREGGVDMRGDFVEGGGVLLILPSQARVDDTPPDQVVGPGEDLVIDGSASTGSINYWRWEFDGGAHVIEGGTTDAMTAAVAFDDLAPILGEGSHTATLLVGWKEGEELLNVSTTGPFGFTLVPEPATLALMGVGLALLARRRK